MHTFRTLALVLAVPLTVLLVIGEPRAGHVDVDATAHTVVKDAANVSSTDVAVLFDLTAVPGDANIDLAELQITADFDPADRSVVNIFTHAALSDWAGELNLTNESVVTSDTLFCSRLLVPATDAAVRIDVTSIVQRWHTGDLANYGFVVSMTVGGEPESLSVTDESGGIKLRLSVFYSK